MDETDEAGRTVIAPMRPSDREGVAAVYAEGIATGDSTFGSARRAGDGATSSVRAQAPGPTAGPGRA